MCRELLKALLAMVDSHIGITERLVGISQEAQRHVLAFDIEEVRTSVKRKERLATQWANSASAIGNWISNLDAHKGSEKPAPNSLSEVAELLTGDDKDALTSKIKQLRVAMDSMAAIQAMTLVQAERGARMTRAYTSMLRGDHHSDAAHPRLYTAHGHAKRGHIASVTLAHKA